MIHRLESFSDSFLPQVRFFSEGFSHFWFLNLLQLPEPSNQPLDRLSTRQAALLVFINSLNHGYRSGYLYNKSQRSYLVDFWGEAWWWTFAPTNWSLQTTVVPTLRSISWRWATLNSGARMSDHLTVDSSCLVTIPSSQGFLMFARLHHYLSLSSTWLRPAVSDTPQQDVGK